MQGKDEANIGNQDDEIKSMVLQQVRVHPKMNAPGTSDPFLTELGYG